MKRSLMMTDAWQRVSPLAVIYFFFNRSLNIVKELVLNSGPILIVGIVAIDDRSFWLFVVGLVIIALLLIDTVISYISFRFQVEGQQVNVKQGFFTKELLNLKFQNIQNVNISVPWYFKPFNLVSCTLDSAGSSAKEVSIPGISSEMADLISRQIHQYHQENLKNLALFLCYRY